MSKAWTWFEPVAQDVEQMRDALRDVVPDGWVEETDPHVSVLPGFEVPEEEMDGVLTALRRIERESDEPVPEVPR